jgi:hypothetical protein
MYIVARKVEIPAKISVRRDVEEVSVDVGMRTKNGNIQDYRMNGIEKRSKSVWL